VKQGLALKSSQDEIIIPGLFFLFFITQLILFEIYSTQVKKNIIIIIINIMMMIIITLLNLC
jgi:hypothetical protein